MLPSPVEYPTAPLRPKGAPGSNGKDAGASVELPVDAGGGHGFGIRQTSPLAGAGWPDRLWDWLFDRGVLNPAC